MRYLQALEQHRHFGRAASACHITQPALSNALRALEAELGVAIVRRGRTYEGLTAEGERVLASANRLLHEQESLRQALHGEAAMPRGRLLLGAVPTAMPIAARFAARLQALHPGIRPVVRSLSSQEIESGLSSLALDLGLGYTDRIDLRRLRIEAVAQYDERYFLLGHDAAVAPGRAASAGATLRIGEPLGWRTAAALPLCLLTPEMHNRHVVDEAFRAAGCTVEPAIETTSIVTLVIAVQAGGVSAVLPGALLSLARSHGALVASPLCEPDVRTPIGFLAASGVRPARVLEAALALARDPAWLAAAVSDSAASIGFGGDGGPAVGSG